MFWLWALGFGRLGFRAFGLALTIFELRFFKLAERFCLPGLFERSAAARCLLLA